MSMTDWHDWHRTYEDPHTWQAQRLSTVQGLIREVLDAVPAGPVTVLAMVAGEGRDLLPVLATHPRRGDVTARLVELDPRNTEAAERAVREYGLPRVEVVTGDAAHLDHYADRAPADLVLICGLFPHITDEDIHRVVRHTTALTKHGGVVIWTRDRRGLDLVPTICGWYEDQGYERVWVSEPGIEHAVAMHRYRGNPTPVPPGVTLFTFVGAPILRP